MFDFMDEITETVEQWIEGTVDAAAGVMLFLIKALIVGTTPIWILPYKIFREKERGREDAGKRDRN